MLRLTPVVRNIIIINVLVYIAQKLIPNLTYLLALYDPATSLFRPYQLFTYMFAHSPNDFFHIFFNMLIMASTAPVLENFWGQKKFLVFYLVTGIGAGVFHLLMNLFFFPNLAGSMLGASGAVYGILMGFGMMFPNMEMRLLIPPVSIKAKYLVWIMGALTFFFSGAGIAHFAHLGGIIFAFILLRIWRHKNGSYF